MLIAIGSGLAVAAIAAIVVLSIGGGGDTSGGPPTEAEVVQALDLSPDPNGTGWITLDGACAVLSIQIGTPPAKRAPNPVTATNGDRTVRAVVVESFSQDQAACVSRISTALRDHF